MRLFHSKTHAVITALLIFVFWVIDAFPIYGPPAFRYTGSDPNNLVWNFGWPLAWFIYDEINPPYWFDWLGKSICVLFFAQGVVIAGCLIVFRMIRKRAPRDS